MLHISNIKKNLVGTYHTTVKHINHFFINVHFIKDKSTSPLESFCF